MQRKYTHSRSRLISCALGCILACSAFLTGCAQGSSEGNSASTDEASTPSVVRIGSMPTEDILPLWVAEKNGYFADENVQVQIEIFDSAPSLSAAITAGQVDLAMTDIMRAVKLTESGTPLDLEWVTLGTTAAQGRFGVLAQGSAPFNTLTELANWIEAHPVGDESGVGAAANTVPEYAFNALMEEEGLADNAIPMIEVASLPERYGLVASGKLLAAALPNSLLTMGEANGMKVIADDTKGENISQSVMVARSDFAQNNATAIDAVARAWDVAAQAINSNPVEFQQLLFEKANIKAELVDIYTISEYPMAMNGSVLAHPSDEMVKPYLDWMKRKGYGAENASYTASTGAITTH